MESELEKNISDNKQESRCENSNSQKPSSSEYFQELEKEGRFAELASLYKEKGDYDSAISCLEKARRAYSLENIAESTLNSKTLILVTLDNPKLIPYFSIPLATNFASGIYEWICYKKKELKEQQQRAQEELRIITPEKYPYKKEE